MKTLHKKATEYLQHLGFVAHLVPGLITDIGEGVDALSSDSYPNILNLSEQLGIEMKHFGTMPMHLCALGIEKLLLSKTSIVDVRL